MKKRLRIRSFTLVEMLVVLSIIGVMLSVSLPAFSRLMAGQGVTGGARELGGMLRMTQAYAIGNNRYAALIIPGNQTSLTSIVPNSHKFRCYRPCVIQYNSTSETCTFVNWVPNTKWEFLPDRTLVFYASTLNTTDSTTKETFTNGKAINDVDFSDISSVSGANSVDISETSGAIVFKPDGSSFGYSPIQTIIGQGTYNNGTSTRTSTVDKITISVNPYTGRLSYD